MSIGLIILLFVLAVIVILAIVVLARTFAFKPPVAPQNAKPYNPGPVPEDVLARLSRAIAIPTVCAQNYPDTDFAPFDAFVSFLEEAYPLFHKTCERTRINTYALVYRWRGADPTLPPMMLTAHYDVVPVEAGTEAEWTHPGFSGAVADGRVWGRGTLDIKSQLTAHLEAAEDLMRAGYTPQRDFLFVYGQDEEIGGKNGALKVAGYFESKGIRPIGVLDEGGIAIHEAVKGVRAPLALVGIAEKGFCNIELTLAGEGGHSSMPPPHTALGEAAKLICKIEQNPLPARLTPPAEQMLRNIAGEMGFVVRMAVANLWLFRPLLLKVLSGSPTTNAMVRTTCAATMARASDAANVLPQRAVATINARLLAGDSAESVAQHFRRLGAGQPLTVERVLTQEASAVSPAQGEVYERIRRQIAEVYPGVIATPYLVMGGTDARKYYNVCDNVYRFTPALITNAEKDSMHSTNENISVENYGRMIYFYKRFIETFDAATKE